MVITLSFFIMSIIISVGISILLVEKSSTWPIKNINIRIRCLLRKVYWKLAWMLYCVTCTSFWVTLLVDICLFFMVGFFMWPLSGFATAGITYLLFELLNRIDSPKNITNNYNMPE
jgi:hypothetical protein